VEAGRECKGIVDLGKALERIGGREGEREVGRERGRKGIVKELKR
jgi:hypothetical protein